jgi:predicted amidohydrolase
MLINLFIDMDGNEERTTEMKICMAQTRPVKGDIEKNIDRHKQFIELALANGADMVIFPELSITGYEPELAKELATTQDDSRFDDFQSLADSRHITIGVGVPTKTPAGICISMVLFQPHKARQTYCKKYIHADEEAFFVSGQSFTGLLGEQTNIGLAICYEISVPQHSEDAFRSGAEIYIASVVKTASQATAAIETLSDIASKYSMTVFMSNCVGLTGGYACGGRSSIWNRQGSLLGQLDDSSEGIIILDTETRELIEKNYQVSDEISLTAYPEKPL